MKRIAYVMMAFAMLFTLSCNPDDSNKGKGGKDDGSESKLGIKIDGVFTDWAAIDASYVTVAKNNPNSPWEGVVEIRCCADPDFVYYYIKYDQETLDELLGLNDELPIRLNINVDGEFESGYLSYSLDGYDFIVEGDLGNGEGAWGEFDATLYQRIDGAWTKPALLEPGHGLVSGKGAGREYEIMLAKEIFNNAAAGSSVPMAFGDVFQTGIRFYETTVGNPGYWEELSNLPNTSIDEGDGSGWGHLMTVNTIK